MNPTERKLARGYLRKLGLQDHPEYRKDPVKLLGDAALLLEGTSTLICSLSDAIRDVQLRDAAVETTRKTQGKALARRNPEVHTAVYNELGRSVGTIVDNCFMIGVDADPDHLSPRTIRLDVPTQGVANVLVVRGDFPYDPRDHEDGIQRVESKTGVIWFGSGDWFGRVQVEPGIHEVHLRAYTGEAGPGLFDICVRLTPKKELKSSVVVMPRRKS
jgi:hypothetical protein